MKQWHFREHSHEIPPKRRVSEILGSFPGLHGGEQGKP
jgi:hypothetical protein